MSSPALRFVRTSFVRTCFLLFVLGAGCCSSGWATQCSPQPRLVCGEFFDNDAVVTAVLLKRQHFQPKGDQDYFRYTLRTVKRLKGQPSSVFQVWEENANSRAPVDWVVGREYLLFMSFNESVHAYQVETCGNSSAISEAAATLKAVARLRTANKQAGGSIQGVVVNENREPIPAVQIKAVNTSNPTSDSHEAITDNAGEFSVSVPTRTYRLDVVRTGFSFHTNMWSLELLDDIEIKNGRCAQLWIEATPVQSKQ